MNSLVTSLRTIIGQYNYELAPNRIGFASLDFEYIVLSVLFLMTFWFICKMLLATMVKRR